MIYLTPKLSPLKMFKVSLWPPSSPDLNPLDYTMFFLENKTNVTSRLNTGSLKTALYLSYLLFIYFLFKLILFYNRVIYYLL